MNHRSFGRIATVTAAGAMLGALLAACTTTDSTSPTVTGLARTTVSHEDGLDAGYVRACKIAGPAGSYTFTIAVQGGGDYFLNFGNQTTLEFDGSTAVCVGLYSAILNDSWSEGETAQITVTEVLPDGITAQEIQVSNVILPFPGYLYSLYNTNTVTVTFNSTDRYKLAFINADAPPPPPSGEGCTPGYWKAKQHWDSWVGYAPAQLINTVFNVPAGLTKDGINLGAYSMVAGLSFQGGSTASGKAEILLRAGIAAVLNTSTNQAYGMTTAQVIAAVNAALASGDPDAMNTLAGQLDLANNQGCALN